LVVSQPLVTIKLIRTTLRRLNVSSASFRGFVRSRDDCSPILHARARARNAMITAREMRVGKLPGISRPHAARRRDGALEPPWPGSASSNACGQAERWRARARDGRDRLGARSNDPPMCGAWQRWRGGSALRASRRSGDRRRRSGASPPEGCCFLGHYAARLRLRACGSRRQSASWCDARGLGASRRALAGSPPEVETSPRAFPLSPRARQYGRTPALEWPRRSRSARRAAAARLRTPSWRRPEDRRKRARRQDCLWPATIFGEVAVSRILPPARR
jgi:hypothetical protein